MQRALATIAPSGGPPSNLVDMGVDHGGGSAEERTELAAVEAPGSQLAISVGDENATTGLGHRLVAGGK